MKWGLRALLAALVALSLGLKLALPHVANRTVDPLAGVTSVLGARLSGPITREPWGGAANPASVLIAPVAGCSEPLTIVTVIPPGFDSEEALRGFQKPGDRRYFAYLDWISDQPDRWRLLEMRIWQRTEAMLNLGEYGATNTLLYVIERPDCHVAETSPWRRYWLTPR